MFLKVLRMHHPTLPRAPRTLMRTPRDCLKMYIGSGVYVHFRLEKALLRHLSLSGNGDHTRTQLYIDGVSPFNASKTQLWPILGCTVLPSTSEPFILGICCGPSKPSSVAQFLADCITELRQLLRDGLQCTPERTVQCSLRSVICDTPARCFLRQVKGHLGYFGCEKCTQEGVRVARCLTFPSSHSPLRTHESFIGQSNPAHHVGDPPFYDISFEMVSTFPLDYMHLVCLGVMKRMLNLWLLSSVDRNLRLSASSVTVISARTSDLQTDIPCDVLRRCRPLTEVERWKATEFRQFLLYT
ncbi:uncharacterized protein DEA37_0000754 [Paragonimus westermani]|uniref:Uncharacterized protein n=1 Tax=Paragonimus westermani TaxID=34504 RepID=A0A5J4NHR7_9TREM|nr:uncharacterized protein DEA37_0000754 [Paragonimus westermani]